MAGFEREVRPQTRREVDVYPDANGAYPQWLVDQVTKARDVNGNLSAHGLHMQVLMMQGRPIRVIKYDDGSDDRGNG